MRVDSSPSLVLPRPRASRGGPRFLWDRWLDTFTAYSRASSAAKQTPSEGYRYQQRVTAEEIRSITAAPGPFNKFATDAPTFIAAVGVPTITPGQPDPFGGTGAVLITDTGAGFQQARTSLDLAHVAGNDLRCGVWVKQEAAALNTVEVQIYGGAAARTQLSFSSVDGASNLRAGVAADIFVAELIAGWYFVSWRAAAVPGGSIHFRCYPALGLEAARWATAAGTAGSITVFAPYIADASVDTDLATNPTPHAFTDEPRLLAEEWAFLEGAETNENDLDDSDFDTWADIGTPVFAYVDGPSGRVRGGCTITDNDGAAFEGVSNAIAEVIGTAYGLSIFVLKDNDETRFPGLTVVHGAVSHGLMVNSRTGAFVDYGATAFDNVTVEDAGDRWRFVADYDATHATVTVSLYPALGTVIGVINVAAVGSTTFSKFQLEAGGLATPVPPSSNIITVAAPATRQSDLMDRVPIGAELAALIESPEGFWFEVEFEFSSTDGVTGYLWSAGAVLTNQYLGGTTFRLRGAPIVDVVAGAWARHDRLRFFIRAGTAANWEMTIWNITQGTGPWTNTAAGVPTGIAASLLRIGGLATVATLNLPGGYSRWAEGSP